MTTRAARPEWEGKPRQGFPTVLAIPAKRSVTHVNGKNTESDNLLRAMVDLCVSAVALLDESGAILYASRAWNLVERENRGDAAPGNSAPEIFQGCRATPSDLDDEANLTLGDDIQQILSGTEKEFHRNYVYQGRAERRTFVAHAARVSLVDSAFRVLITHEDIPRSPDELRNSQDLLSELFATTRIAVWKGEIKDLRFTYVSEQVVMMLGYPPSAWYEPNFFKSHIHPNDSQRVLTTYHQQTRTAEHFDLTFRMLARDGGIVWVENLVSVARENGRPTGMHGFMIDISERKRAEEALKDLGGRLITAQEEERRRVARELHDDFNQKLAVLSIELGQLARQIEKPLSLRRNVQKLQTLAQEISDEIHRLSYKLHPSKLDHLGLPAALKSLCKDVSESSRIKIEFQQTGFSPAINNDITLCLFRITQEALRNCVKHSLAESARVVLTSTHRVVRLSVSDNGCGFDTSPELMERGLGFLSMKERLHILGGAIKVYSRPHRGTRIDAVVPLARELQKITETL